MVLIINGLLFFTQAQASTYDYTGAHPLNSFNQGNGPTYLSNDFLSASVTFDSMVTPNFTGTVGASDVLSWSMNIGSYSFLSTSPGFSAYSVSFIFNNGVIAQSSNFLILGGGYWGSGIPYYNIGTIGSAGYDLACIGAVYNNCIGGYGTGEWTPANISVTAPEPATIWLFLFSSAIMVVVFCGRTSKA